MKNYCFVVEEHDAQAGLTKYYMVHKHGRNINHARQRLEANRNTVLAKGLDYDYKLLTLNEYNRLKASDADRMAWEGFFGRWWLVLCWIAIVIVVIIVSSLGVM